MRINAADNYMPMAKLTFTREEVAGMKGVPDELTNAGKASNATNRTNALEVKQLQTDTLVLFAEAQQKAAEETKGKNIMAFSSTDDKVLSDSEQAANDTKEQETALKEAISKLTMEIMDISMQLAQLKGKDDEKSAKENQSLENELAIKKGMLEAKISQQMDLTKLS
jgi:hypothetical protein